MSSSLYRHLTIRTKCGGEQVHVILCNQIELQQSPLSSQNAPVLIILVWFSDSIYIYIYIPFEFMNGFDLG